MKIEIIKEDDSTYLVIREDQTEVRFRDFFILATYLFQWIEKRKIK